MTEQTEHLELVSGFPDDDYAYVRRDLADSPEDAIQRASEALDGFAGYEVSEVMLTPGTGHPEAPGAPFYVEDPDGWTDYAFEATGEPIAYWKVEPIE